MPLIFKSKCGYYEHGLSNEKLAKLLGVDAGTVAQWERDKRLPLKRSIDIVLSIIDQNAAPY
jgi:transcriptional regulator with XRE-family HTH domain